MNEDQQPMSQRRYRKVGGSRCPFCRSLMIDGGSFTAEGAIAWQEVTCSDCDKAWNDVYNLNGYEETE